ncbi:MAG: hypothetical protein LBS81_00120 [Endomicrobium sp.]|jgi:predicted NBD/HSP70 family sugar kinase|nr:hypothetical protein [Endomicrobium sp.]
MEAVFIDTKSQAPNLICVMVETQVDNVLILNKKFYRDISGTAGKIMSTYVQI